MKLSLEAAYNSIYRKIQKYKYNIIKNLKSCYENFQKRKGHIEDKLWEVCKITISEKFNRDKNKKQGKSHLSADVKKTIQSPAFKTPEKLENSEKKK